MALDISIHLDILIYMTAPLPLLEPSATAYRAEPPAKVATDAAAALERQAALFHALSDPRRLAILARLQGGEQCVCHLQDAIDVGQSLLSFHLKTLREAGLVVSRREGRWMHYSLSAAGLTAAHDAIAALRPSGAPRTAVVCCG
jgi:ArsR family transcriptional regulator